MVGQLGESDPEIVPVSIRQARSARQRPGSIAGDAAARFGINQNRAAHRPQQSAMWLDRL
jgi:hypothetical protein